MNLCDQNFNEFIINFVEVANNDNPLGKLWHTVMIVYIQQKNNIKTGLPSPCTSHTSSG